MDYITKEDYINLREYVKNRSKDHEYKTFLTYKEVKDICNYYLQHKMSGLRKVVSRVISRLENESIIDDRIKEEFRARSLDIFMISVGTFNPNRDIKDGSKKRSTFETFLYGNLERKFQEHMRDCTRSCRCEYVPDIDPETGIQKLDDNGNPKKKPVFELSLYMQIGENKELHEGIKSKYNTEQNSLFEPEYIGENTNKFLRNLSNKNRKIAEYIMDGLTQENIELMYGITKTEYNNAIAEFLLFENVSILKGRMYHGTKR